MAFAIRGGRRRGRELDIRLAHLLDLRGIGLITGDSGSGSGSGKTCACRKVLTQLHTGLYRVIYVSLATGNMMDLYKNISLMQPPDSIRP